jgi:hypothetical protein
MMGAVVPGDAAGNMDQVVWVTLTDKGPVTMKGWRVSTGFVFRFRPGAPISDRTARAWTDRSIEAPRDPFLPRVVPEERTYELGSR